MSTAVARAAAPARQPDYSASRRPGKPALISGVANGGTCVLRPVALLGGGDLVEVKTIGDALRLAGEWQRHAEAIEREARELRTRLAEALGEVRTLETRVEGLMPAALAYFEKSAP